MGKRKYPSTSGQKTEPRRAQFSPHTASQPLVLLLSSILSHKQVAGLPFFPQAAHHLSATLYSPPSEKQSLGEGQRKEGRIPTLCETLCSRPQLPSSW